MAASSKMKKMKSKRSTWVGGIPLAPPSASAWLLAKLKAISLSSKTICTQSTTSSSRVNLRRATSPRTSRNLLTWASNKINIRTQMGLFKTFSMELILETLSNWIRITIVCSNMTAKSFKFCMSLTEIYMRERLVRTRPSMGSANSSRRQETFLRAYGSKIILMGSVKLGTTTETFTKANSATESKTELALNS